MISVLALSWSGVGAFLLVLIGVSFIIFVHEMGHFLAARAVGVKVETFAVGFGSPLITYRRGIGVRLLKSSAPEMVKRAEAHLRGKLDGPGPDGEITPQQIADAAEEIGIGETEYRIAVLPLGGYVKMLGQEDLDPTARSEDPRSFNNKPIWARMIVVSAGVVTNLVFAVLFFMVAFLNGVEFPPAIVGHVSPDKPAATTAAEGHEDIIGLQPGDRIVRINGDTPSDFMEVSAKVLLSRSDEKIEFEIDRPGDRADDPYTRLRFRIAPIEANGQKMTGIGPIADTTIAKFEDDEGASWLTDQLELVGGMRLTGVNSQTIDEYYEFHRALQVSNGRPLALTFRDEQSDALRNVTVKPQPHLRADADGAPNLLGLVPPTRIIGVAKDAAAKGKLQMGDVILAVNDVPMPTVARLIDEIKASGGREQTIEVLRGGERIEVKITPLKRKRVYRLGVVPNVQIEATMIANVYESSPFATANWPQGTVIEAINGQPVTDFNDIVLAASADEDGRLDVEASVPIGGTMTRETHVVNLSEDDITSLDQVMWHAQLPPFAPLQEIQKAGGPIDAVAIGFEKTWLRMQETYITVLRLLQREVNVKQLRGPIGIADIGTQIAQRSWVKLMFFLGMIGAILAVINFLPLPIVDGGLFVLLIVEKLRGGKPVPDRLQNAIALVGVVLILSLFLFVTFNDVKRLFVPEL
ncbi:MAG: hypothetical protein CMJ49_05210 [Planctomycetaceae bacterium]|nr:hypothetical protein [Planctomycetaceae bacterium]